MLLVGLAALRRREDRLEAYATLPRDTPTRLRAKISPLRPLFSAYFEQ
jgi:hypothetical protein